VALPFIAPPLMRLHIIRIIGSLNTTRRNLTQPNNPRDLSLLKLQNTSDKQHTSINLSVFGFSFILMGSLFFLRGRRGLKFKTGSQRMRIIWWDLVKSYIFWAAMFWWAWHVKVSQWRVCPKKDSEISCPNEVMPKNRRALKGFRLFFVFLLGS